MSFLISPCNFNSIHLHFVPPVKNNESDGNFSRIIYSTKNISFNGVGIIVDLAHVIQDFHYKKMFMRFDPHAFANAKTVSRLQTIEAEILEKYVEHVAGGSRQCVYTLAEQLNGGCIKAYANDACTGHETHDNGHGATTHQVMIKICGVWETEGECGIMHKFTQC
jgi:hypothetical protein